MSEYATLNSNFNYLSSSLMYTIKLDNEIVSQTDNLIVANINYRILLKRADLTDNQHTATLLDDESIIKQSAINSMTAKADNNVDITTNQIFIDLSHRLGLSVSDLKSLIKQSQMTITNSKLGGWLSKSDNRKYQAMQLDELYIMLQLICDNHFSATQQTQTELGYSPENYRHLVKQTGLSNAAFIKQFDISKNAFYANIADVTKAGHRSMSYKTWLELRAKVAEFLQ